VDYCCSCVVAMAAAYAYVANKKVVYKYTLPYSAITAPNTAAFEYFLTQSVIFSPVEKNSLSFSLDIKKQNLSLITANSSYEGEIIKEARLIGGKLS